MNKPMSNGATIFGSKGVNLLGGGGGRAMIMGRIHPSNMTAGAMENFSV